MRVEAEWLMSGGKFSDFGGCKSNFLIKFLHHHLATAIPPSQNETIDPFLSKGGSGEWFIHTYKTSLGVLDPASRDLGTNGNRIMWSEATL